MPNEIAIPKVAGSAVTGPQPAKRVRGAIDIDQDLVQQPLVEVGRTADADTLRVTLGAAVDRMCGAQRHEHSPERVDTAVSPGEWRRNSGPRQLMPSVPKARRLPLEAAIIEGFRRRETSMEEVLLAMYYSRISMRQVEDITGALWGSRVSLSTVSQLNRKIADEIEAWRKQPIQGEHAYVYLDSTWLTRTWGGEVKNVRVLVAVGVNEDGYREVLGVAEGTTDDKASWREFLHKLKVRGLDGVRMVIGEKGPGLSESLGEFFPEAAFQRCVLRFYREVWPLIPLSAMWPVAAMLKAIHASADSQTAFDRAAQVVRRLKKMTLPAAAVFVDKSIGETLSYYACPTGHYRALRTNSSLANIMREIRRCAREVDAFPDNSSALLLVSARLRHIANLNWSARRYLDMSRLYFPRNDYDPIRKQTVCPKS